MALPNGLNTSIIVLLHLHHPYPQSLNQIPRSHIIIPPEECHQHFVALGTPLGTPIVKFGTGGVDYSTGGMGSRYHIYGADGKFGLERG